MTKIAESVRNRTGDDIPDVLVHRDVAKAFFGVLQEILAGKSPNSGDVRDISTKASLAIDEIIRAHRIVHWARNPDVQNRMKGEIDDYRFDLRDKEGIALRFEEIDRILESVLDIARLRYA